MRWNKHRHSQKRRLLNQSSHFHRLKSSSQWLHDGAPLGGIQPLTPCSCLGIGNYCKSTRKAEKKLEGVRRERDF